MSTLIEITVPDIGDFEHVEIIEVLVAPGDRVEPESPLIMLESEKTTMAVPSPQAGEVGELVVAVGDRVSQGDRILSLKVADENALDLKHDAPEPPADEAVAAVPEQQPAAVAADVKTKVLVLGAGPGGYTAAFRAADLGLEVLLVEREPVLGGVCLNVGCIPSKALLHTAAIINEVRALEAMGVRYGAPEIDLDALRQGKDKVVKRLTDGLKMMAAKRGVTVVRGTGRFASANQLLVETQEGEQRIDFEHCIIACGSTPSKVRGFPHDDPRVMDSSAALEIAEIPGRLLVVGGGIIGLEMATVYGALGAEVDIVELEKQLMPGADADLVRPLEKLIKQRYRNLWLRTKVERMQAGDDGIAVEFAGAHTGTETYDRVLVAIGRRPNGSQIGAEAAGVAVDEHGFITVDRHMRTNVAHIFAIGDVVGGPMLAHKATHEAKVAAEVIAGLPASFDPLTIPSVAYTDPEVAWMGLTETAAKEQGVAYEKGVFPWAASGRALGIHRDEGMTKLLFDPDTKRILGAGIVGPNAGELIGETVLALEMGADMEDIALTIHPHPTLNETIALAAEMADGSITDLLPPRRAARKS